MSDTLSVLKTAIDMYQSQYAATDKLWAYFSTVSLALVAYTISSDKVTRVFPEAVAAIGAYLVFCAGNFVALSAAQRELYTLAEIVKTHGKPHNFDAESFRVFTSAEVGTFYWAVVVIIVLTSLGLARSRERRQAAAAKPV